MKEIVKIGDYYTYCCQLDLDMVTDEETRKDIQDELDNGNEIGIFVWHSLKELKEFYKEPDDYKELLIALKRLPHP